MDSQVHRVESMRHKSLVFVSHRKQVGQLVERASNQPDTHRFAMLFLLSYAFLLRLPSEAIPVTAHTGDCSLKKEGMFLVLSLKRRKNKPGGSRLVRGCWCRESKQTCPMHVLGPYLANCRPGERLFLGITSAVALSTLRLSLQSIGVARSHECRTHDLRRGHAKDLQLSGTMPRFPVDPSCAHCVSLGAPLWKILEAGEWRSPAFLSYLDMHRLETDLVVQAHLAESESDDEKVTSLPFFWLVSRGPMHNTIGGFYIALRVSNGYGAHALSHPPSMG